MKTLLIRHGTHSMYNAGCHCDRCKRSEMDYRRWRLVNPRPDTRHSHIVRSTHPPLSHPGRVAGLRSVNWEPDEVACLCWCQQGTVGVTPAEVRAGQTRSCGRPGCNETVIR